MQDLKVAIIQSQQFWEDKEKNLNHFESQFLSKVSSNQVDLILLPEMFNTGFSMNAEQLFETMQGESIQWLKYWAEKLNAKLGASLIIKENNKFFNRFVIVGADGVETHYDKRHLFRMANENDYFTAGSKRVIYQLKGWNIMLQVCYDLRFPVFSRNKTIGLNKEYDALIYIANWPEKRAYVWKNLIQARAIENQSYTLGINRVGLDGKGISYSGDSMFVDPWGNVLTQFESQLQELQIVCLKKSVLAEIQTNFPAYLDAD